MTLQKDSKTGRVREVNNDPSLTQQHQASETDINKIAAQLLRTGLVPVKNGSPMFGDFSFVNSTSYMDMKNTVIDMGHKFDAMPSRIRRIFGNDPFQMLRFIENPENHEEAVRLGILPAPPAPEPDPNQQTLLQPQGGSKPPVTPPAAPAAEPSAKPAQPA